MDEERKKDVVEVGRPVWGVLVMIWPDVPRRSREACRVSCGAEQSSAVQSSAVATGRSAAASLSGLVLQGLSPLKGAAVGHEHHVQHKP